VAPVRRAGSLRRTTTIEASWPSGPREPAIYLGRARDIRTPISGDGGTPELVSQAEATLLIDAQRTILSIVTDPVRAGTASLVGVKGGGRWRASVVEAIPEDHEAGSPLHLLLDDIAGASLVSAFAHTRWDAPMATVTDMPRPAGAPTMEGICAGFRPGSTSIAENGMPRMTHDTRPTGSPVRPDDPKGWHQLSDMPPRSLRRARRIDLWREVDGSISIDAWFQDSAGDPEHGRIAFHEYQLLATADPSGVVRTISAIPRVLPYSECVEAAVHVDHLVGLPLRSLRLATKTAIPVLDHCTHLSDAARALADVPSLLIELEVGLG
jgi:hypothetical protein